MSADSGGGFVGEMQNLVVNGNQVFEMLRSGEFKGRSQVRGGGTATLIGPSRLTPPSPLTFRSSDAYVVVNMKIHSTFSIYIQVFLSSFMIIYRVYCFCQGHLPPKSIHFHSFPFLPRWPWIFPFFGRLPILTAWDMGELSELPTGSGAEPRAAKSEFTWRFCGRIISCGYLAVNFV